MYIQIIVLAWIIKMAEMNVAFDYDMYLLDRQNQNRRRVFERFNPRRTMPKAQIKKAFRFTSENIDKLIQLTR